MNVTVQIIDISSPHLKAVKALGKSSRATLGFMPEGAFDEHASKRSILGAISETGQCVGYVLYRRTTDSIKIAHLCVMPEFRGHNIARKLVDELSRLESVYRGIGLRCRRDFDANKVWPRLGFVARSERAGKSFAGKPLTYWWREHSHPTLFTGLEDPGRVLAVIDANVFFDLQSDRERSHAESSALLADWLSDSLTLCVTEELFNEIARNEKGERERDRMRKQAELFKRCPGSSWEIIEYLSKALAELLPVTGRTSDESDIRQLARAIAGKVSFFITRDKRLLDAAEKIEQVFSVVVVRPSDLIVHFDELRQEALYQPRRLSGTTLRVARVETGKDELLAASLVNHSKHESQTAFLAKLRPHLAQPNSTDCEVVADPDGAPLALIVSRREPSGELHVPVFRVAAGALASTLSRHLLFRCLKKAVQNHCHAVRVADPYMDEVTAQAVRSDSFFPAKDKTWVRFVLAQVDTAEALLGRLHGFLRSSQDSAEGLETLLSKLSPELLAADRLYAASFERSFWPAKIADASLPIYIVPIQPRWAQHLFDERLAAQDLFGARIDLALNRESAYYRAARPMLEAPARILWYVSQSTKFGGTGAVTACSRLDEVVTDVPKSLFKRFRRLGVYEWAHVRETAKGDLEHKIMALRFVDSEALAQPVPRKRLLSILKEFGVRTQIQSPVRIPSDAFIRIYGSSST
jgi:GNAT superfamily N-acetyltransferase/predicted nucleic acid-binding protein